jgi:hypothetical protein
VNEETIARVGLQRHIKTLLNIVFKIFAILLHNRLCTIGRTQKMGISGWKEKVRNRDQWRRIIEEAKAQPGL